LTDFRCALTVDALCGGVLQTIPSVKKEEAIRCFVEAQMTGSSLIITVTEEHAEHYVQQLKRQQVYAKMEKEKKG